MRLFFPLILISIAVAGFLTLVKPFYDGIAAIRAQATAYDQALTNSKALENERDKLVRKYNSFDPVDLENLAKLLPDNVDNIRLILEIEKIAAPYGMALKNVKYEAAKAASTASVESPRIGQIEGAATVVAASPGDYGTWNLEFSVTGAYDDFLSFVQDLEKNLRIVDITSIDFSSGAGGSGGQDEVYTYSFKIRTYWLKN